MYVEQSGVLQARTRVAPVPQVLFAIVSNYTRDSTPPSIQLFLRILFPKTRSQNRLSLVYVYPA